MRNFIIGLLIVGAGVLDNVHAQCLGSFQWPGVTFTPTCTGSPQTIDACNYAGDYAVLQLTAGTLYTFGSSISTDYFTVTTTGNVALTQGTQPVTFTPGTTGSYRVHIHSDASCGTNSTCRITTVQCGTPPTPCSSITTISGCGVSYTATLDAASTMNPILCGHNSLGAERIYSYTPSATGNHTINVSSASGGFVNYAFKAASAGCSATGWTCIGFGNSAGDVGTVSLTAGVEYYILVVGQSAPSRTQTFSITSCPGLPPPPPANEYLSFFHWTNGQLSATNWQSDSDPIYSDAIGGKDGCVFADVTITNSGPWVGSGHPRYAYSSEGMPASAGFGMRLHADWTNINQQIVYTITFKEGSGGPISEFLTSFSIYDINSHVCGTASSSRFIDEVEVIGYRANLTTAVNPNLTPATNSGGLLCSDNQIIGNVVKGATTCGNSRLNVDFGSTPVARVQIIYRSSTGHPANQNCGTNPNPLALGDNPQDQFVLLSAFALTGGCITLPVEFNQFNATCLNSEAHLNWSTFTELNNDYFTIERSSDGYVFEEIAQVTGSGTTNQSSTYQWVDDRPFPGLSYYRLSQTDYDGTRTVLKTLSFVNDCANLEAELEVYPNPTVNESTIRLVLPEDTELELQLVDAGGRLIREILAAQPTPAGVLEIVLPTHELASGVYIIRASLNKEIKTLKLLK
jgi:hypothetical protein